MHCCYSTTDPSHNEFDSLPRVSLLLRHERQTVEAIGLLDSGVTINGMTGSSEFMARVRSVSAINSAF